jgi:hypothetical protein
MQQPGYRNVMPPVRQGPKTWYQRLLTFAQSQWTAADPGARQVLGLMAIFGVLALLCGMLSFASALSGRRVAQQPQDSVPTDTPVPTSVPISGISGAVLGGTAQAFGAKYGAPYLNWDTGSNTSFSLNNVPMNLRLFLKSATDGTPHVWEAQISHRDGSYHPVTQGQAQAACGALLPGDAAHVSDNWDGFANNHIYRSDLLAATFPSSMFVDRARHGVPPGTLRLSVIPADGDSSMVAWCELQLGQ